ncbi:MAG: hypothetical protein N2691_05815 [Patescibacteria group bacterium]|nr:hypothetical protein [Patescibacteria group bacterium]
MLLRIGLGFAAFFAILCVVAGIVYYIQAQQHELKELAFASYRKSIAQAEDRKSQKNTSPGPASETNLSRRTPDMYLIISGTGITPRRTTVKPGTLIAIKNRSKNPVKVEIPRIFSPNRIVLDSGEERRYMFELEGEYFFVLPESGKASTLLVSGDTTKK